MFGYIKPDKDNLLVKDLALYKASYCGLCSALKKRISFLMPMTLSYDFVFLAMIRATVAGEAVSVKRGRCKYNPLKRCAFATCESQTEITAKTALILTTLKLEDDINDKDSSFWKKLILKPLYNHLKRKMKRLNGYDELITSLRELLAELTILEKANSPDIDKLCEIFGKLLAEIASFEFSSNNATIARAIGFETGRYIYLIDAIDDVDKDAKNNTFNPLIARFGSAKEAKEHFKELDVSLALYTKEALLAVNLLNESEYTRIIKNILGAGLGANTYKIMTKNGGKK